MKIKTYKIKFKSSNGYELKARNIEDVIEQTRKLKRILNLNFESISVKYKRKYIKLNESFLKIEAPDLYK